MSSIFSLSGFSLLILFAVFAAVSYGVATLALRVFHQQWRRNPDTLPVPAFIGTIGTAWALALGFAAADVWAIRGEAMQVASAERSSIERLAGMAGPDALNRPAFAAALENYRKAVMEEEWRGNANTAPMAEVDAALQQIRLDLIAIAHGGETPSLVSKMTHDFDELQDARNQRLAIGSSSVSEYKWYLVLSLTVLTMVALAAAHADRPPAARNALGIFGAAAMLSLWILGIHASPYAGAARLSATEIAAIAAPAGS